MQVTTNSKNELLILFGALGAISGVVALFTYLEQRKQRKLKEEIAYLDKEIKQLELVKRKNEIVTGAAA